MGLRNFLTRRRTPAEGTNPYQAVWAAPAVREPLTADQRKDLDAAWAELTQAIGDSEVTSFHACTRDGRYWGEDPDAVRAMTAIIRDVTKDAAEE